MILVKNMFWYEDWKMRRLKDKDKLQNLNEIKEIGDIYLLEKY